MGSNRFKVLLVEDEIVFKKTFLKYLETNYDFELTDASDGIKAYNLYKEIKPHLIITDIEMPKMCGLTLVEKIRQNDKETKIVVLSAHSDRDKLLKAIELNLSSYHIKPFNISSFEISMAKIIDELQESKYYYFQDDIYFDFSLNSLFKDNKEVKLSKYELRLLKLFCENKNTLLSAEKIHFTVWDDITKFNSQNVRTLVKKLRKRLPQDAIESIYSQGYILK